VFALRLERVSSGVLRASEFLANSWREWRWGPLRVINHALYAGVATTVGLAVVVAVLGPHSVRPALTAGFAGLLGAGLWAQWVEGSPQLLRPYGFYGGVVGIVLGALAAPLFNVGTWELLAAFALAAPFVQALGRLRCLVQGCCHGAPVRIAPGIVYTHPRSRVVRLSPWAGQPIHATPLYSMLGNAVIACVLTRLWMAQVPATFLGGLYLLLSGLARFVEEAYRGESQTPIERGLRLYQWIALGSVLGGAVITTLPSASVSGRLQFSAVGVGSALLLGLVAAVALGVDFPNSNRRYSRLV
jgi:hypothetical protein